MDLCAYLHSELKKLKNQEYHHDEQKAKETKVADKVKAKLGTDGKTSPVKIAARIAKTPRKKAAPKPRRRKGVGRIPPGALAIA